MEHGPHSDQPSHHAMMAHDFMTRFYVSLCLTPPVLALSPMVQSWVGYSVSFAGDSYILFLLSAFVYAYGGLPFTKGLVTELKKRTPGMMTLIGLAITVAFLYSSAVVFGLEGKLFFWEIVTLIDLMLLGHWIEMRAVMGASNAIEELAGLLPATAHLVDVDDEIVDVPLPSLRIGSLVLVRPGESVPADGIVHHGASQVNEAMVTGESVPVPKKAGDRVIGGSITTDGSIYVKVTGLGADTYLSSVMALVSQAQQSKSETQTLADRAALYLTLISLSVGALTFAAWSLAGHESVFSIERMVTVMVITCPHALGLAIPLVIAVSASIGVKKGVLIKNRVAFESLRKVDTVVFDKTGTLTKGDFSVSDIFPAAAYTTDTLLTAAASLEKESEHPIARAIVDSAMQRSLKLQKTATFTSIVGEGIMGDVDGAMVRIVGHAYVTSRGTVPDDTRAAHAIEEGKTVVYCFVDGSYGGAIALADSIREESYQAIEMLKAQGIRTMMMTGDNSRVAQSVGDALGLDDVIAEVAPGGKSARIDALQKEGRSVCMVGDGINDAPALVQADVGIAIGTGTNVAIESADVILVKGDPRAVSTSIALSELTYRKMKQNLYWATGYNAVTIPLAAGVLYPVGFVVSPALGAVLMSLSTVIVAINAKFMSL